MLFLIILKTEVKLLKYKIWLVEWLTLYVKPSTKERTFKKYQRLCNLHIIPSLGELEINLLSANTLQRFTISLSEKGLSSSTVNGIISVVKSSLRRATLLGVTGREFTSAIVRPKIREKQVECFTKEEQRKIERYILAKNNPKLFGVIITLYTGLRIGELLSLTWEDLDVKKGLLHVNKSCRDGWKNGKYFKIIDTPKTESSKRVIPLPKQLLSMLKEYKNPTICPYLVTGKTKHGAQIRSYQKTFELLLKRLKIKHKGFHSLRHTFATRALECGMDVKTLSEILGHKNATVTLHRYTHSLLEHKTEMMNKLGKLLN